MRPMNLLGLRILLACALWAVGCSPESGSSSTRGTGPSGLRAAATSSVALAPGVIARVGSFDILAERIALIAEAQHVLPKAAVDLEIRDALFASGALDKRLSDTPSVAAALRGRLAREALSRIAQQAAVQDPTDNEVREATARHFVELDRPETSRVIHAVVRVAPDADGATKARAKEVADRIKRAVGHADNPSDFRARAEAVEHAGLDVTIEELKPVAADGRVVDPDQARTQGNEPGHYVPPFAAAAARLARPGDLSDLVETEFGWHVLMLLERVGAHTVALEERRRLLRDEIVAGRARRSAEELRNELRNKHKPVIERSAETLLVGVIVPTQ
jgi:hypothetical protein